MRVTLDDQSDVALLQASAQVGARHHCNIIAASQQSRESGRCEVRDGNAANALQIGQRCKSLDLAVATADHHPMLLCDLAKR